MGMIPNICLLSAPSHCEHDLRNALSITCCKAAPNRLKKNSDLRLKMVGLVAWNTKEYQSKPGKRTETSKCTY